MGRRAFFGFDIRGAFVGFANRLRVVRDTFFGFDARLRRAARLAPEYVESKLTRTEVKHEARPILPPAPAQHC